MKLRLLCIAISTVPSALALLVAANPTLTRASDASKVGLTSLWKEDERSVLVFLRHFG